jgi:hypothetical protein
MDQARLPFFIVFKGVPLERKILLLSIFGQNAQVLHQVFVGVFTLVEPSDDSCDIPAEVRTIH